MSSAILKPPELCLGFSDISVLKHKTNTFFFSSSKECVTVLLGPPHEHEKFITKPLNSEQVAVETVSRAVQLVTIDSPLAVGEGISCIETNHALHTHSQSHTQRTGVKVNAAAWKRTWICSHCNEAASAIPE